MISFSNFKDDGNVKTFEGKEYHVTEDKVAHKQYQDSEAQFHSLYNHPGSSSGAYIDMKKFLENEKTQITQETEKNSKKAPGSRTNLFLHDLPLQGEYLSQHFEW